mmetsp:Transcript_1676/g.5872  ORF Transcript_1676/g.5872 Transcript_1676/m.5872 type:complete len:293 (-) Transcript_1676:1141-2019(-)
MQSSSCKISKRTSICTTRTTTPHSTWTSESSRPLHTTTQRNTQRPRPSVTSASQRTQTTSSCRVASSTSKGSLTMLGKCSRRRASSSATMQQSSTTLPSRISNSSAIRSATNSSRTLSKRESESIQSCPWAVSLKATRSGVWAIQRSSRTPLSSRLSTSSMQSSTLQVTSTMLVLLFRICLHEMRTNSTLSHCTTRLFSRWTTMPTRASRSSSISFRILPSHKRPLPTYSFSIANTTIILLLQMYWLRMATSRSDISHRISMTFWRHSLRARLHQRRHTGNSIFWRQNTLTD